MSAQGNQTVQGTQPAEAQAEVERVQLVSFQAGGADFAIDILRIKEVIQPVPITVVPRAPAFLDGVIDVRGAILPIIDLRRRFGLEKQGSGRDKYIIVASDVGLGPGRRIILALIADRVREPVNVPKSELKPAPPLIHLDTDARTFAAVMQHANRLHLVIDVDRLLGPRERATLAGRDFGGPT